MFQYYCSTLPPPTVRQIHEIWNEVHIRMGYKWKEKCWLNSEIKTNYTPHTSTIYITSIAVCVMHAIFAQLFACDIYIVFIEIF